MITAAELHAAIVGIAADGFGQRTPVVVRTDGHQLHIDRVEVHPIAGSRRRPRDLKIVLVADGPTVL